jgi:D-3-phosphoglycerate dehydrogenase
MDIPGAAAKVLREFTNNDSVAISPEASKSVASSINAVRRRTYSSSMPRALRPFVSKDFKILLLENINETGQKILRKQGYVVEAIDKSLPKSELIEKIKYERTSHNIVNQTDRSQGCQCHWNKVKDTAYGRGAIAC